MGVTRGVPAHLFYFGTAPVIDVCQRTFHYLEDNVYKADYLIGSKRSSRGTGVRRSRTRFILRLPARSLSLKFVEDEPID